VPSIRSRKVRRILRLDVQAARGGPTGEGPGAGGAPAAPHRGAPERGPGDRREPHRRPARRAPARPEGGAVSAPETSTTPASETAPACPHCRRPVEVVTIEFPCGLGPRTWPVECPCEAERREAEQRRRRLEAHRARVRRLLAQSGIGPRYRDATFETFEATPATAPLLDVCRAFVARFPDRSGDGVAAMRYQWVCRWWRSGQWACPCRTGAWTCQWLWGSRTGSPGSCSCWWCGSWRCRCAWAVASCSCRCA
jgi:hypothetical protein